MSSFETLSIKPLGIGIGRCLTGTLSLASTTAVFGGSLVVGGVLGVSALTAHRVIALAQQYSDYYSKNIDQIKKDKQRLLESQVMLNDHIEGMKEILKIDTIQKELHDLSKIDSIQIKRMGGCTDFINSIINNNCDLPKDLMLDQLNKTVRTLHKNLLKKDLVKLSQAIQVSMRNMDYKNCEFITRNNSIVFRAKKSEKTIYAKIDKNLGIVLDIAGMTGSDCKKEIMNLSNEIKKLSGLDFVQNSIIFHNKKEGGDLIEEVKPFFDLNKKEKSEIITAIKDDLKKQYLIKNTQIRTNIKS